MHWQKALALVGVGLITLAVVITAASFFGWPLAKYAWHPRRPDSHINGDWAYPGPPVCFILLEKGERNVTVNTSFPLTITIKPGISLPCQADVFISAPTFDVKPESQAFVLPDEQGHQWKSYTFLLVPKQTGNQLVMVSSKYGQDMLYYTVKSSEFLPAWMTPFSGPLLSLFGPILTIPWWIDRLEKKRQETTKGRKNVADQKRLGRMMEDGRHLYNEITDLRGEDLEAWAARLTEWQTSVRAALEDMDFPADSPEFMRATDEIEPVAIVGDVKNLKWKQEVRRRKLQKQQQKLEEIVRRRLS